MRKKHIHKKNEKKLAARQPLVSIVMPTYNAAEYLSDTLDGLTKQTFTDFEIIFVDDGSDDETVAILQDFAAKFGRATVLQQKHQFAGAARNLGMQHAQGKYLLFLDGDDLFWPQMLERAVEKSENTGADICVFGTNRMDHETGKVLEMPWTMRIEHCPNEEVFSIKTNAKRIFEFTTPAPWNKLLRSDFVRKYGLTFQETRQSNDVAFICTSLALASKICVVNEVLQTHRINNKKSLQGTNDSRPECFYEAMQELKNRLVKYGVYEQAKPAFLNFALDSCFHNLGMLRCAFSYEEIFYRIRDELLDYYGLNDEPDDYFYAYKNHNVEKRKDINSLSVYEYARKWIKPEKFYERTAAMMAEKGGFEVTDMRPKISVIMPCLNSMEYLEECLSSVLGQTLQDIEIIVVDAGSTDGTVEYIEAQAKQDPRISLIHSEKKSYGYQLNLGMDHARGEFMAIVESDDYIVPDMYERLYGLAKRNTLEVVKSDFSRFTGDKDNRTFAPASVLKDEKKYNRIKNVRTDTSIFNAYVLITPAIYSLAFLRKNHIRANESPGASYQDNGFWFQVLMHADRMWFYPKPLYMLRRDNPNSSVKSKGKVYAMCDEYDFVRSLIGDNPEAVRMFAPYVARRRFITYRFTMERIADEYKLDFMIRFAQDFRKLRDAGELRGSLFSDGDWKILTEIMEDPARYYLSTYYHAFSSAADKRGSAHPKKKTEPAKKGKGKAEPAKKGKAEPAKKKTEPPKKGKPESSKKGKAKKVFSQKIHGLRRCVDENGYIYTGKRIIEHFGIDMGTPDFERKH